MGEIAVAIADDNERILDLLGEIIDADESLNLVGKANNGEEAYSIIKEKQPDVMLLDLIMPKMDGLSVMDMVNKDKEIEKRPGFIIVTAVSQERITEDAFRIPKQIGEGHAEKFWAARIDRTSSILHINFRIRKISWQKRKGGDPDGEAKENRGYAERPQHEG